MCRIAERRKRASDLMASIATDDMKVMHFDCVHIVVQYVNSAGSGKTKIKSIPEIPRPRQRQHVLRQRTKQSASRPRQQQDSIA